MFRGIQKDELEIFWYDALELLRPALAMNGDHTATSIKRALDKGDLQLWCHFGGEKMDAAAVTEIADYPKRRVCMIVLLGGEGLPNWLPYLETIEAWAKEKGAHVLRIEGREEWARVLAGYSKTAVIAQRELQ